MHVQPPPPSTTYSIDDFILFTDTAKDFLEKEWVSLSNKSKVLKTILDKNGLEKISNKFSHFLKKMTTENQSSILLHNLKKLHENWILDVLASKSKKKNK